MSDDDRREQLPLCGPHMDEPPRAIITREGWLWYSIDIQQGLMGLTQPYSRPGRRWAERCARRKLAILDRQKPTWTVTL